MCDYSTLLSCVCLTFGLPWLCDCRWMLCCSTLPSLLSWQTHTAHTQTHTHDHGTHIWQLCTSQRGSATSQHWIFKVMRICWMPTTARSLLFFSSVNAQSTFFQSIKLILSGVSFLGNPFWQSVNSTDTGILCAYQKGQRQWFSFHSLVNSWTKLEVVKIFINVSNNLNHSYCCYSQITILIQKHLTVQPHHEVNHTVCLTTTFLSKPLEQS